MNSLSLFGDKRKGFTIEKLNCFKNKARRCDPFDIKLMDRFIDAIFAYHNPSARLLPCRARARLPPVKLAQTVCGHLKDGRPTNTEVYYMAGSASGQDDSNPALWLVTRAGKMELSCPLGITRCPSAWHRKFNPGQQCNFSSIFSLFWGKYLLKCSVVNSQHLAKGKEREWNHPGVVKILFQLQWMWVEPVSCSVCR